MAFTTYAATNYSALYQAYLDEQDNTQQTSKFWLRIRQIMYIMIMAGLFTWVMWMGFTEPGTMWHFTILTTLRSDPGPCPGICFPPQHPQPLHAFAYLVFPTMFGVVLVLRRMAKSDWTLGGMCLLYVLMVSSTVAALAVHVYL
jgi:hypothetical protein